MPPLDPLSLRLFVAVAEAGTIAAAAEREHIAAAAVSRRISEIEATLGVALLRRTNKGVAPTDAGERLIALAHRALHQLDDVTVQMRDYASGTSGLVRMAANISSIVQFLPREIQSFAAKHPHVRIQLEEKPSALVVRAVADNAADLGVFTAVPHGYPVQSFPYHTDNLVLVTPPGHALADAGSIAFVDALDFEFVALPGDTAISQQLTRAANALARGVNVRIQVTSYDAQCLMIGAELGLGVMPDAVAQQHAHALRLGVVALTDDWAQRELLIGVRSLDALPEACRMLVAHLAGV
ncbi:LysR substrate-binding domain-containing protein [Paraburkholderia sp.]|uniref:LysR substrate-binding domain-containing protein n=1 Tax=Paraburkholderia sp. TaxID=1926495 RepID=UPI0023A36FAE|nr:LysR substrate-binding domain-containing protein [Paraburkholderia sp.]MDE1182189.1 LysR substrate-binding domain-containing protein [Paraburkholderia sp.]